MWFLRAGSKARKRRGNNMWKTGREKKERRQGSLQGSSLERVSLSRRNICVLLKSPSSLFHLLEGERAKRESDVYCTTLVNSDTRAVAGKIQLFFFRGIPSHYTMYTKRKIANHPRRLMRGTLSPSRRIIDENPNRNGLWVIRTFENPHRVVVFRYFRMMCNVILSPLFLSCPIA